MKKRKNKKEENIFLIPLRYILLLCFMFSLPLIYKIFLPLTIYPVFGLLKLIFNQVNVIHDVLIINLDKFIQIIPACIAGSAYLLLLILNLSVQMPLKKRFYSIIFSFLFLLVLNIIRIFFLAILYYYDVALFDFTHKLFWYILSTVFVIIIWFLTAKIFAIKKIPVYSDIKFLIKSIKY